MILPHIKKLGNASKTESLPSVLVLKSVTRLKT